MIVCHRNVKFPKACHWSASNEPITSAYLLRQLWTTPHKPDKYKSTFELLIIISFIGFNISYSCSLIVRRGDTHFGGPSCDLGSKKISE